MAAITICSDLGLYISKEILVRKEKDYILLSKKKVSSPCLRGEGEGEMYGESNMEIKNTICENGNLLYDSGNSNRGSVTINKGGMGREMGGRLGKVGLWVYLWLILVMYDRKPQNSVKQLTFN